MGVQLAYRTPRRKKDWAFAGRRGRVCSGRPGPLIEVLLSAPHLGPSGLGLQAGAPKTHIHLSVLIGFDGWRQPFPVEDRDEGGRRLAPPELA